jgi:hypothetical protein
MKAVNTAAQRRGDKHPDRSNTRNRRSAPAVDALFKGKATDFFSTFIQLSQLHKRINTGKAEIGPHTVDMIASLLLEQAYDHQKQGFFLYREAAETLADCVQFANSQQIAGQVLETLTLVLSATRGDAHRAAAGALGALPLSLRGPVLNGEPSRPAPVVSYSTLLRQAGLEESAALEIKGRSLVISSSGGDRVLVLKMARQGDTLQDLQRETDWMCHLKGCRHAFGQRFDIPEPIQVAKATIYRLIDVSPARLPAVPLHPDKYAAGFKTTRAYFDYPNESCPEKRLGTEQFQEVMLRNAWLLGRLASMGIFHDALIPLFHNRTQRGRRDDQGAYEWVRGGRLDRWLHSCEHPNIGVSGVRDFEHLQALDGRNSRPYRSMGKHFVSLLLVTGSYFRKKDPSLMGWEKNDQPVDARGLFEKTVLIDTIVGIFHKYYQGFTGSCFCKKVPFDLNELTERMIEEMGVDRHMEETIRVADQQALNDREFRSFLIGRGVEEGKIEFLPRGAADLVIQSGPHLGAFNSRISLPELIEFTASAAAVCVAGKYWQERCGENQASRGIVHSS